MFKRISRVLGVAALFVLMQGLEKGSTVTAQGTCNCWGVASTWMFVWQDPRCSQDTPYNLSLIHISEPTRPY